MPEQRYVNHIDQKPFVAPDDIKGSPLLDLSDVHISGIDQNYDANGSHVPEDAKTEFHVPDHVGETVVLKTYQKAEYAGPSIKVPEADGNVEENAVDWSGQNDHISTAQAMALLLNQHLALKAQVVRAFRHLGLDVVRFFPE